MSDIQLSLTVAEAQDVINVLGQLPTSSGAYPLLMKIKAQADACIKAKENSNAISG